MGKSLDLSAAHVIVTGGAGFLGSCVVERLRAHGASQIYVPRSRDYDLTQLEAIRRLYTEHHPTLVIHLAARVGGIGENQKNPAKFFYDNLMMGMQLLHEAHRAGVDKFVAVGTVCAYPKYAQVPFREDDLWNGYPEETNAPYGMAKKMLLVQSQAYRQQYGYNSVVLFPANLYGPGDNFDLDRSHVIPALIRKIDAAMVEGRDEVVLWGDGSPTREFLYVEDAAEGIVLAAELYDESVPMNLGSGREISIAQLAQKIGTLMNYHGGYCFDTSRPNGQPRRRLDVTHASECLGFVPSTEMDAGLAKTIEYFRQHYNALMGPRPI